MSLLHRKAKRMSGLLQASAAWQLLFWCACAKQQPSLEAPVSMTHPTPQTYRAQREDAYLQLRVELTVSETEIDLVYQAVARPSMELVLLDALWQFLPSGQEVPAPELAFASFVKPETLVLHRSVPALPTHKDVERAYLPWCRVLRPGEPLQGHIKLPVPTLESSPYYPHHSRAVYRTEQAHQIELHLEYRLKEQLGSMSPIAAVPGVLSCELGASPPHELRTVLKLTQPLPVRRRSDQFEPV